MLYPNLKFPRVKRRPFFYTNFVSTLDGKVAVKNPGYWPIGSRADYDVLLELRAYADALIHGGNVAREYGEVTFKTLNKPSFKKLRKKLGKNPLLPYFYVTSKPETIKLPLGAGVFHLPGWKLQKLVRELNRKGYKYVLVEGGPTLLGSFLKENLIDEIFITLAPKIYGSDPKKTLTLVEGILFKPSQIKKFKLVSVKKVGNELFIRYGHLTQTYKP